MHIDLMFYLKINLLLKKMSDAQEMKTFHHEQFSHNYIQWDSSDVNIELISIPYSKKLWR